MQILITGGAGYLGSILVEKLINSKLEKKFHNSESHALNYDKITVYDNLLYKQYGLISNCYRGDFEFVLGDVRDKYKLLEYVKQADVIIPLAAIVGFPACEKNPILAYDINYGHIKTIVDALSPNQRIIYPNTNSGYGVGKDDIFCDENTPLHPISHYGKTKCMAEDYVINSHQGIVLRLATVFGTSPRMRLDLLVNDFCYQAITNKYIVLFEKHFKRNYIHIRDVALTFIYMINNFDKYKGRVFNVGLDEANLSKFGLCQKIKDQFPELIIIENNFMQDIDQRNYIVSNKRLRDTGWKSYYTIENGIEELLKAYTILSEVNKPFTNL